MVSNNHGWAGIVRQLEADLNRISANHISAVENDYGLPVFRYSTTGLTEKQATLAASIVERAEKVAQETCATCGEYGRLSYSVAAGRSRILCDKHRPKDWNTV